MRHVLFFLHLIFLATFLSCSETKTTKLDCNVKIDSLSQPISVYNDLKNCSSKQIDDVYFNYLLSVDLNSKSDASLAHLAYYKKLNKSKNTDNKIGAFNDLYEGIRLNKRAQFDSANIILNRALKVFKKYNFKLAIAENYRVLALNDTYKGDFNSSYIRHVEALKMFEALGDTFQIYKVKSDISVDLYKLKEYDKAVKNAKQTLRYFEQDSNQFMQAYQESLLSVFYSTKKQYDSSEVYADRSLEKRLKLNDQHDIGESYNNLALSQMGKKQWEKALFSLGKADSLMTLVGDLRQLPIIRKNKARAKKELGDLGGALAIILSNIDKTIKSGQKEIAMVNMQDAIKIYLSKKDFAKALALTEKSNALKEELYNFEKGKEVSNIENKYELELQQKTIQKLTLEKQIQRYLVVFLICITALIIALLIMMYRKRKLQIESNKKQLELLKNSIIKKNKLIDELEISLSNPAQKSVGSEKMSQLFQFKILTEEDWLEFKLLFDRVYPGMINKLRKKYYSITPAEERQFLLIKLQMDNSECSNMLGVSNETVKKNRYRLKKRLDLDKGENLEEFVILFS